MRRPRIADRLAIVRTRILIRTEELSGQQAAPPLVLGLLHALSGNLDQAFRLLETAVEERHIWTIPMLRTPLFAEFLGGARYQALFRKMNLA